MIKFLKKYWVFVALSFVSALLIFIRIFINRPDSFVLQPAPSWQGITPGKTKTDELKNTLGEPYSTSSDRGRDLFYFNPEEGGPPHEVVVENETIELIKEQYYGEQKLNDFKTKYGEPTGEFFGPYESMGFKVFVFPENGIATVSSIGDGTVIEIWYFEPTTLSSFLQRWGKDLRTEPSGGRF